MEDLITGLIVTAGISGCVVLFYAIVICVCWFDR